MKQIFILLLLLLAGNCMGQKIVGTVRDTDERALPFATISVEGTSFGVTTNQTGFFELQLPAGNYTLDCRYVGYQSERRKVNPAVGVVDTVHFVLRKQTLTLDEVVLQTTEDPAYEIIRNAIKKREYYRKLDENFSAEVYTKGLVKLKELPSKLLGQKIDEAEKEIAGLDSSGKGILYLSESLSRVYKKQPDHVKVEVLASRVSGSSNPAFDFPIFISLYENTVNVFGGVLNKRGYVSPIASGAQGFYDYRFLGSFYEKGELVNSIQVIPKRRFEPTFSGKIQIVDGDWRIHSFDLVLLKNNQLEILDTLRIAQLHTPVDAEIWKVKSQIIHFAFDQLGIRANGDFVNVYSNYEVDPAFGKKFFDRVVISYDSTALEKRDDFWNEHRAVPLEREEIADYLKKDSLLEVRKNAPPPSLDSLRKRQGPVRLARVVLSGVSRTHYDSLHPFDYSITPLSQSVEFNTVEGWSLNPSLVISKIVQPLNMRVSVLADVRYGFSNRHVNPWGGIVFGSNDSFRIHKIPKRVRVFVAGGKRVSEFFKESNLDPLGTTVGTLLWGRNERKIYENYFFKGGFSKEWPSTLKVVAEARFEDRIPLQNTTEAIWNHKWQKRLTPNYPVEVMDAPFDRHNAAAVRAEVSVQPGQRYIQYPRSKVALGSKFPRFGLSYEKGLSGILNSRVDYDKWNFTAAQTVRMKLAGEIRYKAGVGGFLNSKSVPVQDFHHFNSNISTIAAQYLESFQNVPHYRFSNAASFYSEIHLEHHANGLLTNQVHGLRELKWYLVTGANFLMVDGRAPYTEFTLGLENILKIGRADVVFSFYEGKATTAFRVGFSGLIGDALNTLRFRRYEKIIGKW